jgi:hypothetical protein
METHNREKERSEHIMEEAVTATFAAFGGVVLVGGAEGVVDIEVAAGSVCDEDG